MLKISPIVTKKLSWDKTHLDSRLEWNIKGKNITHTILNSLRRTIQTDIPIYAFNKIKITKNTSVFNNNYMRLRLENLPVFGIVNNKDIYVPEKKKTEEEIFDESMGIVPDDIDMDVDKSVNTSSLEQITMYLNYKNESKGIVSVTTDDAKFYFAEKSIKTPYSNPVPIIKLQPGQEISLSAVSQLGIEKMSSIFSPVSICCYKQKTENDYDFIMESRGQLSEKRILELAIININNQLEKFIKLVPENKGMEGTIVVPNADHTLGNIIADGLNNHSAVHFAGYNMPHPLDNKIVFHYKLETGNIKKVLDEVIAYYQELFTRLNKEITKLG